VNHGAMAVPLSPGPRRISLRYVPPGLLAGSALGGLGVLCVGLVLRRQRRGAGSA